MHDKLFLFVNYERQHYVIGAHSPATEPTAAWVKQATALLTEHNIPVSPTSLNVLCLWPQGNKPSGGATSNNFFDTRPQNGYSDNTVGKLMESDSAPDAFGYGRLSEPDVSPVNAGSQYLGVLPGRSQPCS